MIPFLNLQKLNEPYEAALKTKFSEVLKSGWYILGADVTSFENAYASYCGTSYCIGTANGMDALKIILEGYKLLGVLNNGDHVLVASNAYIATILAIKHAGLTPILVEVDSATFNFDMGDLQAKISSRVKVILPTHLYGCLANMQTISSIAKSNDLLIVSDAAQSHGAQDSKGNRSGALADAAAHSFYPTKNLGALGDAGAITTNNRELAEIITQYRNYGFDKRYVANYAGVNSRLDALQAAFLNVKLKNLNRENSKRQAIAKRYINEISNDEILLPEVPNDKSHVFHLFVIRSSKRDLLKQFLEENGIKTIVHYPVPPHKQKALQELKHLSFPVSEQLHKEVLSLPTDPTLCETQITQIIEAVNRFSC